MKRLSALDATFFHMETPQTPQVGSLLQIFRRPAGESASFVEELFRYLQGCPVIAPPFNYRLVRSPLAVFTPAFEEATDIDLSRHLYYRKLPAPGGQRELGILVSALQSEPLDRTRPLWELHVIDGLEEDRFALCFKGHHALMDGATSMKVALPQSDVPTEMQVLPFWAVPPSRSASSKSFFARMADMPRRIFQPYKTGAELTKVLAESFAVLRTSPDALRPPEVPLSIINNPVSSRRRVATQAFDLARIKAVGKAAGGATVNDVLLAICAGALRHFLLELDALPDKGLVASVPVALPRKEGEEGGNKVSAILVQLATDVADPKERLVVVRAAADRAKQLQRRLPPQFSELLFIVGTVPMLIDRLRGTRFKEKLLFNLVISNVPGPRHALYFNGAPMEAVYPVSVLVHGPGLNMTAIGYNGRLYLGIVCSESVPHIQRLAVHAGEALHELEAAFGLEARATPVRRVETSTTKRPHRRARTARKRQGKSMPSQRGRSAG